MKISLLYLLSIMMFLSCLSPIESTNEIEEDLNFELQNVLIRSDSIHFHFVIRNDAALPIRLLDLNRETICYNVVNISLLDIEGEKKYFLFPCKEIYDIDHIKLTTSNSSIFLPSNQKEIILSGSFKDFTPFLSKEELKNRRYLVRCNLSFDEVTKSFDDTLNYTSTVQLESSIKF